jgi:hypothetical protein
VRGDHEVPLPIRFMGSIRESVRRMLSPPPLGCSKLCHRPQSNRGGRQVPVVTILSRSKKQIMRAESTIAMRPHLSQNEEVAALSLMRGGAARGRGSREQSRKGNGGNENNGFDLKAIKKEQLRR